MLLFGEMLKINKLKQIANWLLSGKILLKMAFLPTAYYTGEAAKLENSEKSLTFAAQLFLNNLRGQDNPALKSWMANESRDLFERAEKLNPDNDSTKIGLGATYIFGSTGEEPAGSDERNPENPGSNPQRFA